jgi:hypothetical protein
VYVSGEIFTSLKYRSVLWKNKVLVAPFDGSTDAYRSFYALYVD